MRILFITSSRLAEAVTSCGVLEQLRNNYPKARITVACGARTAGLFARLPKIERVIIASRDSNGHFQRFRLWRQLIGNYWDIAVDMRGSNITRFLRTGERKIIRIHTSGTRYKQFGDAMGFSPAPFPVTWSGPADHDEAERRMPAGAPIIGLGPTSGSKRKIWPPERYVETYKAVAANVPGCRAVIFSGDSDAERQQAAAIQAQLPGAICLSDKLGLPLLAACMARLRLFIGNDTGLLHLAAATGVPTLGLFGRNRGQAAPAGLHAAAVFATDPKSEKSIRALTVEAVIVAALPLLKQGRSSR